LANFVTWDYSCPGISFQVGRGKIGIFKQTLMAMGSPEYFHFLFSPADKKFGIEPCGIDDEGAKHLRSEIDDEYNEISCKNLVRYVYKVCGWDRTISYRVPGRIYSSDSRLVYFDLQKALEIHEGRLMKIEKQ